MKKVPQWAKVLIARISTPLQRGVRADCIGANPVSWWLRKRLERVSLRQIIGVNLAGVAFFSAVVVPQAQDIVSTVEMSSVKPEQSIVVVIPTEATFQWPISRFSLSQRFSFFHPGIDLATEKGTPIYSVADGTVIWTNSYPWGYGNHVFIEHTKDVQSLYAHMSTILVKTGQEVTKKTQVGEVGATGWATGNHLHFEMYQYGTPVNPLEVLPELPIEAK